MSNISNEEREKYYQYLLSSEWENKKKLLISKRGDRCEQCFFKKPLDVHHKTYERIFNEMEEDLVLLCRDCHKHHHRLSYERYMDEKGIYYDKPKKPYTDLPKHTNRHLRRRMNYWD